MKCIFNNIKALIFILVISGNLFSIKPEKIFFNLHQDEILNAMIGQMVITGFLGGNLKRAADLQTFILEYRIGGLLIQDFNIKNKTQIIKLISDINDFNPGVPLFFCIDEEGGNVRRLKEKYGYRNNDYSPAELGSTNKRSFSKEAYKLLVSDIKDTGINFNFAPVVDVIINTNNPIIAKQNRSYSSNISIINKQAKLFLNEMNKASVLSSLKHFPGHGSSKGDSHKGMVDITETFNPQELIPFKKLKNKASSVMVGHLYHRDYDTKYPASLSKTIITDLLKDEIRFKGLIITDDINMKALSDSFSYQEIVYNAINAGNDIILINDPETAKEVFNIMYELVQTGEITRERIEYSFKKIIKYKKKYNIL